MLLNKFKKMICYGLATAMLAGGGLCLPLYNSEIAQAASESEVVKSYVSFRITTSFNDEFLEAYELSLVESGIKADEAKKTVRKLRGEINEKGTLSDADLEKARKEFCEKKIDEKIGQIFDAIGIENKDISVVRNTMSYGFEAELTNEQIVKAEALTKYYTVVTVADEIGNYKGKIGNTLLLDELRKGEEKYNVTVRLKSETDDERSAYVKEKLGIAGVTSFGKIVPAVYEDEEILEVDITVNDEQLKKLCEIEEVIELSGIYQNAQDITPVSPPPTMQEESFRGDVNEDEVIDVSDLTLLSLYLIGDVELSSRQKLNCDVDYDWEVTIADLPRLQQYLSKKIPYF
ncbi:MAG: dockerin type I repeat-containing protein [Oscillospiraceae bacterium]|nr:dockerin type I repeat-containing protein [Oscillospiraceae bacterium]